MPRPIDDPLLQKDHPWVKKYRLPVVYGCGTGYYYFVSVHVPEENPSYELDVMSPNEEEGRILASYLNYIIDRQGFYQRYLDQMAEREVDIDSGYPTKSFEKRKNGNWAYHVSTWRHGPWPFWNAEKQFPNIVDLLDHIEKTFPDRWNAWKVKNNIVSGV